MKMLLTDFRSVFRKRILDLLWSQWTVFGVSGQWNTNSRNSFKRGGRRIGDKVLYLFKFLFFRYYWASL